MRKKLKALPLVLHHGSPKERLALIADVLNCAEHPVWRDAEPGDHEKLKRLVQAWLDSGPDFSKMKLSRDSRAGSTDTLRLQVEAAIQTQFFFPAGTGRAYILIEPKKVPVSRDAPEYVGNEFIKHLKCRFRDVSLAHVFFARLITNEMWDYFGGPCARCGRYYVKKTIRQKVYCQNDCGPKATSKQCKQRQATKDAEAKLAVAVSLWSRWDQMSAIQRAPWRDWKEWLVRHPEGQAVNLKRSFLTRHL